MKKKLMGNTDLEVAPFAFGGNVFGWTIGKEQSFEILDAFAAAGFNLIDTANTYSHWVEGNQGGESEKIIGDWMSKKKNRNEILIATKAGGRGKYWPKPDNSRKHITEQVELSLKRLQTDYIDLYQLHYDDGISEPEEVLDTFNELKKKGKIRWFGASNMSTERLGNYMETAIKLHVEGFCTLQPNYNLYDRQEFEAGYLPIVQKYELSVISYYSLASGFLSGKYRKEEDLTKSKRGKDVLKYMNERGFRILSALDEISAELNTTAASVSLSWLSKQPSVAAPIVSATTIKQLESIINAVSIELTDEMLKKLNDASIY